MSEYGLIIIGAGVGGYVTALRVSQLGIKPVVVEMEDTLGGTCLNWGCIPSKALLESSELFAAARDDFAEHGLSTGTLSFDLERMMARKRTVVGQLTDGVRGLFDRRKIPVVRGRARLSAPGHVTVETAEGTVELTADHVLIATGSQPIELPALPFDGERIVSSKEALSFEQVPEHLVVVGGGAIGLELGSVWLRLGARVTVVEMLPRVTPFADRHASSTLQRALKGQGMDIRVKTRVIAAEVTDGGVAVTTEDARDRQEVLAADRVLVAVGRAPRTEGLGLDDVGVAMDERGRVVVDEHYRTSVAGVYAIGDVIGGAMLAHKAEEEGVALAEQLAGGAVPVHYDAIPSVVYTHPELASVGATEEQLKERGTAYKTGRFLFRANGRALSMGATEGLVKILADADDDRILGIHIVGPHASELIAEATLAVSKDMTATQLAETCHAHPTLAEAVKEAALDVHGKAIHA